MSLISSSLGNISDLALPAYYGMGVGFDAGVTLKSGGLSASIVVRDVGGTAFDYSSASLGTIIEAVSTGSIPQASSGTPVTDECSFRCLFQPGFG